MNKYLVTDELEYVQKISKNKRVRSDTIGYIVKCSVNPTHSEYKDLIRPQNAILWMCFTFGKYRLRIREKFTTVLSDCRCVCFVILSRVTFTLVTRVYTHILRGRDDHVCTHTFYGDAMTLSIINNVKRKK